MTADDDVISRERAIQIVRDGIHGIGNGTIEDMVLESEPPVWVVTAMTESGSEAPFLARITIRVRRRIRLDALTGHVLSREVVGDPEYIPDAGHASRFVSRVWRHELTHAGVSHDVVIYTIQLYPSRFSGLLHRYRMTRYEALVDGEWASPSGHVWYLSYEDALAAALEAVAGG
jgi:hypothetical protein